MRIINFEKLNVTDQILSLRINIEVYLFIKENKHLLVNALIYSLLNYTINNDP